MRKFDQIYNHGGFPSQYQLIRKMNKNLQTAKEVYLIDQYDLMMHPVNNTLLNTSCTIQTLNTK